MSKNVAVFVDVANIFYAAKAAGVDIDYVTLLKSAIASRDFVRAYAYTGLDPDNENQRNFHDFLRRHGYKVVSKDIRKYGDGKVKANLDIELVVDMLKTARNLDVAIVVSGDGDFAPAIRAVQEMGVRVEVISFRGNTSSDLMEVADQFTDIVQIARVEKGTSRSGRRVADDDEDLSMTEVPDKQTEGTGRGRGTTRRTTSRSRTTEAEQEPVAASGRASTRTRRPSAPEMTAAAASALGLVALPGEKLSKAPQASPAGEAALDVADEEGREIATEPELPVAAGAEDGDALEPRRRRRRRGGRGRGRGRGRPEDVGSAESAAPARPVGFDADEEEDVPAPPRAPKSAAFGSFWDSQTGQARTPSVESTPFDLEDEEEPAIPEYLLAEQRRGATGGRGQPGRANRGRAGYAAAIDRERYGRGGGGGGFNRYPDVSGRSGTRGGAPRRDDRPMTSERPMDRPAAGRSDEPWSEVPPELEAMLRAQLASKSGGQPAERRSSEPRPSNRVPSTDVVSDAAAVAAGPAAAERPSRSTPKRSTAGQASPSAPAGEEASADTPKPAAHRSRSTSSRTSRTSSSAAAKAEAVPSASGEAAPTSTASKRAKPSTGAAASKRTISSRAKTESSGTEVAGTEVAGTAAEPKAPTSKGRATKKKAETTEA